MQDNPRHPYEWYQHEMPYYTPPEVISVRAEDLRKMQPLPCNTLRGWLRRDTVHHVYIGPVRSVDGAKKGSVWAPPKGMDSSSPTFLQDYEAYVRASPDLMRNIGGLACKTLGCWCAPGPCHGDVLVKLLNERHEETRQYCARNDIGYYGAAYTRPEPPQSPPPQSPPEHPVSLTASPVESPVASPPVSPEVPAVSSEPTTALVEVRQLPPLFYTRQRELSEFMDPTPEERERRRCRLMAMLDRFAGVHFIGTDDDDPTSDHQDTPSPKRVRFEEPPVQPPVQPPKAPVQEPAQVSPKKIQRKGYVACSHEGCLTYQKEGGTAAHTTFCPSDCTDNEHKSRHECLMPCPCGGKLWCDRHRPPHPDPRHRGKRSAYCTNCLMTECDACRMPGTFVRIGGITLYCWQCAQNVTCFFKGGVCPNPTFAETPVGPVCHAHYRH